MWQPTSVVPGSIMPAYKYFFEQNIDIETVYAEAYTVKTVFNTPYDKDLDGDGQVDVKLGTFEEAKSLAMEEAKAVVADMKNQDVKDALERGEIREIVALTAYLNSLK
jgi:cytochrome c oxidase cbb3-type subunit 2